MKSHLMLVGCLVSVFVVGAVASEDHPSPQHSGVIVELPSAAQAADVARSVRLASPDYHTKMNLVAMEIWKAMNDGDIITSIDVSEWTNATVLQIEKTLTAQGYVVDTHPSPVSDDSFLNISWEL